MTSTTPSFDEVNGLDYAGLHPLLTTVCSSPEWVDAVISARPFGTFDELLRVSDAAVSALSAEGIAAAIDGHPRIGDRTAGGDSAHEQAAVLDAGDDFAARMAEANARYEERFGHVYLVAAAGRSPETLLGLLEQRLSNSPEEETEVLRGELAAINRLRLARLLAEPEPGVPAEPEEPELVPVSTHVLDTTTGRPAVGILVELTGPDGLVARGRTDDDGRIPGFAKVPPGRYTAVFHTGEYFPDNLYPEVAITLNLPPGKVHLPLLLSPFAYSTYRGS